jgi:hypothetical protein
MGIQILQKFENIFVIGVEFSFYPATSLQVNRRLSIVVIFSDVAGVHERSKRIFNNGQRQGRQRKFEFRVSRPAVFS